MSKIKSIMGGFGMLKRSLKAPTAIAIESSGECQANCIMCGRDENLRERQHLPMSTFEKIIIEAKELRVKVFQLSFYGEPLMDPYFLNKVAFLKQEIPDSIVVFNTNGALLTRETILKIFELKVNIVRISIDGNNKDEYESIRRGLSYDGLLDNVKLFKELKDELSVDTQLVIWGHSLKQYPLIDNDFRAFWSEWSDSISIRNEHSIILDSKENLLQKVAPCYKPFAYFVVSANGDVVFCDRDWGGKVIYGSVLNQSISEIWKSRGMKKTRVIHLLGLKKAMPLCQNCAYKPLNTHYQNSMFKN